MTLRQIDLTAAQSRATRRANQDGSVYLLSGTLRGRGAVADVAFAWATHTFSGALGEFDGYIQKPARIVRSQEYLPGAGASFPGVSIPVRNLPFADRVSMLAAIDDGEFAWENSEASLLVGYLSPGQRAEDLAAGDWTYLVKDGVFGPPSNVELDGFSATLYMRGARRPQVFRQPLMPGVDEARGLLPGVSGLNAFDRKDMGIPLPLVIGKPDSWYRLPTFNMGVRGFVLSGYAAGATVIQFRALTDGLSRLSEEGTPAVSGLHKLRIHYRTPAYPVVSGSAVYDEEAQVYTVTLSSGLAGDVPRGAFIQEMLYGPPGNPEGNSYSWVVAGHPFLNLTAASDPRLADRVGWLLPDGTIRPADLGTYNWRLGTGGLVQQTSGTAWSVTLLDLLNGTEANPVTSGVVPCFFDPIQPAQVTQQPAFESDLRADSKLNYPTGGTGTDNALARDGSDQTAAGIPAGTNITLTFNSEASGDFADGDTIASVLHVIAFGNLTFSSPSLVAFGSIAGSAVRQSYRFQQVAARPFNQTIRIDGDTGGGTLFEAWWEHDLATTKAATRTADVLLNTSASGLVGEVMQYADLVFRVPGDVDDSATSVGTVLTHFPGGTAPVATGFMVNEVVSGATRAIPYPTAAMLFIQSYFLGPDVSGVSGVVPGEGTLLQVNSGVYQVAQDHYAASGIRWNFVLQDRVNSWAELEQALAIQAQAHFYYGPTGHEIIYREGLDLAGSGVVQEFRLPGVPGCNTTRAAGPLIQRMDTSEVVNTAGARWNPDTIEGGELRNVTEAQNAESVLLFGERRDPQTQGGAYEFWAHSPWENHPTFDAALGVSGVMRFYADRAAFARSRFEFETAWIAHGVERGSPVRVIYEVAPNVYRNVACEVEEITVDPINGDLFGIRCRALDAPTPGLPIFTWEDLFTSTSDVWTDYIASGETWKKKWSL